LSGALPKKGAQFGLIWFNTLWLSLALFGDVNIAKVAATWEFFCKLACERAARVKLSLTSDKK
jgi:hypothetical protein